MPKLALVSGGRWLLKVLTLAMLVTFVPGCTGLAGGGTSSGDANTLNTAVFSEGYSLITERYIEPVVVRQLALDGLAGLSDVDSSISVDSEGGKVLLKSNDVSFSEFPVPGRNDTESWAELTTEIIVTSREASPTLAALPPEKFYETVFDAALEKLDRYSRYASAAEAREHRADREGFGGIGMHLSLIDGVTRIVAVIPDTPAERSGVKDNDVITAIEGQPIHGLDLREVVRRLRGPVGTLARFSVTRHGLPQPLAFAIERERIIPTSVIYRREGDLAYFRITRFNQGTAKSFRESLAVARAEIGPDLAGLIIDLRDNPGGLLDQAVAVTDSLLRGGRIVSTEGRHRGSFQQYDAADNDIANNLPIVVLINGGSASASEIMAAALQDDGRAVIVGTNSYGKGVVQSVYRLPNDGELTLTWSRFHAPSGYNLQDLGVLPTICTAELKGGGVAELVRAVREGRIGTKAALATWRRERLPDAAAREKLRATCPAGRHAPGEEDYDLTLAKAVLHDQGTYTAALSESSAPELARRH